MGAEEWNQAVILYHDGRVLYADFGLSSLSLSVSLSPLQLGSVRFHPHAEWLNIRGWCASRGRGRWAEVKRFDVFSRYIVRGRGKARAYI